MLFSAYAFSSSALSQEQSHISLRLVSDDDLVVGARQTGRYFPLLEGKRIAVVANQTSLIGEVHLVDSLLNAGMSVSKVFCPEHGFRGNAEAGQKIRNGKDPATGLAVISLYGRNYKPTRKDLRRIDLVLFDLQDVGARFYTYISTMSYVMEACAEQGIPMIILDRPNPNGFFVDGPILSEPYESFVGLHPVPIVYGMSIGEYALMVNGEGWLSQGVRCDIKVIKVKNYDHNMICQLPVKPSPNLPNWQSIYLYPSLALFEGTMISEGRGTDRPFQIFGHPDFRTGSYTFTPKSLPGAEYPKYRDQRCYGLIVRNHAMNFKENPRQLNIHWLIEMAKYFSGRKDFFNNYFNYLAGNTSLKDQIKLGMSEEDIRKSWENGLEKFRKIRKLYLLYPDSIDQ